MNEATGSFAKHNFFAVASDFNYREDSEDAALAEVSDAHLWTRVCVLSVTKGVGSKGSQEENNPKQRSPDSCTCPSGSQFWSMFSQAVSRLLGAST